MAESAQLAYAVCPRIERDGSTRVPKLFESETAAIEFRNSRHEFGERYRDLGWQAPVPIRRLVDYSGPRCDRTLQDFPSITAVDVMCNSSMLKRIQRDTDGRSADYTCLLDQDWRFDEIQAKAATGLGNEFDGGRYDSIGEIVFEVLHDLEEALRGLRPTLPCRAVADFWCSWQVQQYIAEFCF